ncbi:MAG: MDR family MFS transporter [Labedaea sp.]
MTAISTAAPAPGPAPGPGELPRRQLMAIIGGLLMAALLAALDQTVVVTAMRTIADDLDGLHLQAWVSTGYLITSTATIPLYGKLGDLFGRRRVILFAISIFVVGSVLCGLAVSMYTLAGARAVQGLGAGGLLSIVSAIVGDIVPARERGRYQGYFVSVYIVSSLLGPLTGGFFAEHGHLLGISGWRWAFLVNIPIGLTALAIVFRVLRIPETPRRARVDWLGAVTLTVAVVPILIVLAQGQDWGWGSARVLVLAGVGLLGLVSFVLVQRRMGAEALVPTEFFRNRSFTVGTAATLLVGLCMLGVLVTLPLYLQIVKGTSPTEAGLMLITLTVAMMIGSMLAGRYMDRTGRYKIVPVVGSLVMAVGLMLFQTIGADTAVWQTGCYMAVFGFGLGLCTHTLTLAVQNSLPARHIGVATASQTFARQIGGMIGVATFLSVLFSTVRDRIGDAFRAVRSTPELVAAAADPAVRANPANQPVLRALSDGSVDRIPLDDSSFIAHLDERLARPIHIGFAESMSWVFLIACAVALIGFVLLLFLEERPLSTQSHLAARNSGDA